MLPPSHILSNHSHQIYHPLPLLPSAFPRFCAPGSYTLRHPRVIHYEPLPPNDSSPFYDLPDELVLEVFNYLDWKQLLPLQRACLRFNTLAQSGSLNHHLTLTTLPPYPLPGSLVRILPNVKHLHLHLLPYPSTSSSATKTITALLESIKPDQLLSLSLPFSAPYLSATELGKVISRIGGKLEKLDLRGSGLAGKGWLDWLGEVGKNGKGLKDLDVGFTNITDLPSFPHSTPTSSPEIDNPAPMALSPFRNLRTLSLASCTSLSASAIYTFLNNLPPTLETLDISRLEQTSYEALKGMNANTDLREIKVVGIDHLTRLDIRRLKFHWESQRRVSSPEIGGDGIPVSEARVWGEPRTPNLNSIYNPPKTPDSLPRLSSSSGYESEPSSLGSASSRLHESISPRLLTPDNSPDELPRLDYGRKHPFLADLKTQSGPTYPSVTPCSDGIDHKKAEKEKEDDVSINIIHSAILESEDEAGYRQFIGEVAGGTVGLGLGHGYGLGMRWINQ